MLFLVAVLLASPPIAPPVDPTQIAYKLADTAPEGREALLNEFSWMWSLASWSPVKRAKRFASSKRAPVPELVSLGRAMGGLGLLGLNLLPRLTLAGVAAQLAWRRYDWMVRGASSGSKFVWWLSDNFDAQEMKKLRAAVQLNDGEFHAENLLELTWAHQRRGEPEASKPLLTEALKTLRRTPSPEYRVWESAQLVCLHLGDYRAAADLLRYRPDPLKPLDELVRYAFKYDAVDEVLGAVPVLFSVGSKGEDPRPGCPDTLKPERWKILKSWSARLIEAGYFTLHQSLVGLTPDSTMRDALRASAADTLTSDGRYAEAWAVIAQMDRKNTDVEVDDCLLILAPGQLRSRARLELMEGAADAGHSAIALKAIESAFATGEVAEFPWDSVINSAEKQGDIQALAAIVGKRRPRNLKVGDAQRVWAEAMLLSANPQAIYAARTSIKRLLADPKLIASLALQIKAAERALAEAALSTGDGVLPEKRLAGALNLAKIYVARGDTMRARTALKSAWPALELLAEREVAAWSDWARLRLLLDEGPAAIKQASGLPNVATQLKALVAIGDSALDLLQAETNVAAASAVASTVKASTKGATKGPTNAGACASPAEALVESTVNPWLQRWVEQGRLDVAVQIARLLPKRVRGRALAALIVQMANERRPVEAFEVLREVAPELSGCLAGKAEPRDIAWLGLIDAALTQSRFKVARSALNAMPVAMITQPERVGDLIRRLFDGVNTVLGMPDLSLMLSRADTPPAIRAIVHRQMVGGHLKWGRISAALAVAKDSDRRTQMLLLLAIAREPDTRLVEDAAAIRALGQ